jgi:hypothetical protein
LNWRTVITALLAVLVLWMGFAWLRAKKSKPSDPLRTLGPGLYQPKQDQAGELLPLPPPPPRKP